MKAGELQTILKRFKTGEIGDAEVLEALKSSAIGSLEFARIDHCREMRQGFPEVIFCEGKTPEQVLQIAERILKRHQKLLATRADSRVFDVVKKKLPDLQYNPTARCFHSRFPQPAPGAEGQIAVITAGTADVPVAEEAVTTCRLFAFPPVKIYDVGVSGLHRLNPNLKTIRRAGVLIVIAGMEGALPSVIGGLVDKPVIAVPTSAGYGTSFGGLTALFAMLNSCSSNVSVVNIDNGFGAAFSASLMIRQIINQK